MKNYKAKAIEMLKDGSTSYWLKEAIRKLDNADVIDALNDIEALQELLMLKFEGIKKDFEYRKAYDAIWCNHFASFDDYKRYEESKVA